MVKNMPANAGDTGAVRGGGRSAGVGNGNPVPGKFHEQRSPLGYSPWGHKESEMTEQLSNNSSNNLSSGAWNTFSRSSPY